MSKHHVIKCWPYWFEAVSVGRKPFEIRFNDRDYKEGDRVTLQEFVPPTTIGMQGSYTGRELDRIISYVFTHDMEANLAGQHVLAEGVCVFGLREVPEDNDDLDVAEIGAVLAQ